jgi:hypothetical protein
MGMKPDGSGGVQGGSGNLGDPICEDLKPVVFAGSGVIPASGADTMQSGNCAWYAIGASTSNSSPDDAFIYTKNIKFANTGTDGIKADTPPSDMDLSKGINIHRAVFTTFGGACIDVRRKYLLSTNYLVGSTNKYWALAND